MTVERVPTTANLADRLTRLPFNRPKEPLEVVASLPRESAASQFSCAQVYDAQASDEVVQEVLQQLQSG